MKKFFFIFGLFMLLFLVDQRTYAHMLTYIMVGILVLGMCAIIVITFVMFDQWWQKNVFTRIEEMRDRERERTRNMARYRHINRLR